MRTIQMPNFSFHRSSTPTPYSLGKPALNCCGGSFSTLGNMKRPVAASAAAAGAEKAAPAQPLHARRGGKGLGRRGRQPPQLPAWPPEWRLSLQPHLLARQCWWFFRRGLGAERREDAERLQA